MSEKGDKLREMAVLADEEADLEDRQNQLKDELKSWLSNQVISSDEDIAKNLSTKFNINLTEAKKQLEKLRKRLDLRDSE